MTGPEVALLVVSSTLLWEDGVQLSERISTKICTSVKCFFATFCKVKNYGLWLLGVILDAARKQLSAKNP